MPTSRPDAVTEQTYAASAVARRPVPAWFREARFGLFAHWGPYSVAAGTWKGRRIEKLGEWMQCLERIPLREYRTLAEQLDTSGFDADQWCRLAAKAGMRYLVYGAKHHDGFAMYDSKVSDYNLVAARRGNIDPLAALAEACPRYGLKLGFYYSHVIDWEHPEAGSVQGNTWDFDPAKQDFSRYYREKALPQVEELLTRYGEIALVWFDMPDGLAPEQAQAMRQLVRRLRPEAVVNSRLGGDDYDYVTTDDNYVPTGPIAGDWEMPATTNGSWGYKAWDQDWKPFSALRHTLLHTCSRGGNLLLNIGPTATGALPAGAVRILEDFAPWMERAGPAIHATGSSPFPWSLPWGYATTKPGRIFLHLAEPHEGPLDLPGLASPVLDASLNGAPVCFDQDAERCTLHVPPLEAGTVVTLTVEEPVRVKPPPAWADGIVRLDAWLATSKAPEKVYRWTLPPGVAGTYRVELHSKETGSYHHIQWNARGACGVVRVGASALSFTLQADERVAYPALHFWKRVISRVGEFLLGPGTSELILEGIEVADSKWSPTGLNLLQIVLIPVGKDTLEAPPSCS